MGPLLQVLQAPLQFAGQVLQVPRAGVTGYPQGLADHPLDPGEGQGEYEMVPMAGKPE